MKSHLLGPVFVAAVLSISACNCGSEQLVEARCLTQEICGNGLDDTCDGVVDEGCPCEPGATRVCGSNVGACREGLQTCDADGVWMELCEGEVAPRTETCDEADDDCDGEVDEDFVCERPIVMCPASQQAPVNQRVFLSAYVMDQGVPVVSQGWSVKSRPQGSTGTPFPATGLGTSLVVDGEGIWTLEFCATSERGAKSCCEAEIDAIVPCTMPPAPPVSTACETSWDGRPIVQFSAVPQGLVYELLQDDVPLATAEAGHNHVRPPERIHPGSNEPGEQVTLGVRACRSDNLWCCSTQSQVSVRVVSECATPIPATKDNLILSEYLVNGEGACSGQNCGCQNGEAIELTNLTNCPVSLDGFHFAYRNDNASVASYRWMNFGPTDIVPPRGVYVAVRNRNLATTCAASLGQEHDGLYGLKISSLEMQGENLCSGWFKNGGGGQSELRVAPGQVSSPMSLQCTPGNAITRIAPYESSPGICQSTGFDAIDSCGNVVGGSTPKDVLSPNQLGRLWHPCDAVLSPAPMCVRD